MCPELIKEVATKPINDKPTDKEYIDLAAFLQAKGVKPAEITAAIGLSAGKNRQETVDKLRMWLRTRPKA